MTTAVSLEVVLEVALVVIVDDLRQLVGDAALVHATDVRVRQRLEVRYLPQHARRQPVILPRIRYVQLDPPQQETLTTRTIPRLKQLTLRTTFNKAAEYLESLINLERIDIPVDQLPKACVVHEAVPEVRQVHHCAP